VLPWEVYAVVGAAGGAGLLGLALLPLLPRLRPYLPRSARLRRLVDGAGVYLLHRRVLLLSTALSVVVQLLNVVLVWVIGEALGLRIPPLYYGVWVPLVTLLTLLPVSVNGMGLREFGTVLLLEPLGVSAGAAVTLSLLTFAAFSVSSVAGAGFYLFGHLPRFEGPPAAEAAEDPEPGPWPRTGAGPEERCHADPVRGYPDQGRARQPPAVA
jgi:hypothetical protein